MSLIQYQQATYAVQLRQRLELAGCDTRIAAVLAQAAGELLDHLEQARSDVRRDLDARDCRAVIHATGLKTARRERLDRFVAVSVVALVAAVVGGVLISLLP